MPSLCIACKAPGQHKAVCSVATDLTMSSGLLLGHTKPSSKLEMPLGMPHGPSLLSMSCITVADAQPTLSK